MRRKGTMRKPLIRAVLLLAATLVLAACGGGGVQSDELSSVVEQSVAAAVAAAVPGAAPPGPSVAEISAMVRQAVEAAAPEGVSAAEIGTLVEAAVVAATKPAVSAAEIEALVTQAVEQAASEAATPLSSSEVEAIVAAAVEAIPEPEPVVVAMPTAAAEAMELVVVKGTHRIAGAATDLSRMDPVHPQPFWAMLMWDDLVTQDFETGEVAPLLAESWSSNGDATQWTFNLTDALHSDGSPVVSADVVHSVLRHLDPDTGSRFGEAQLLGILDPDGFQMPDDKTVVFSLLSTSVDFPLTMTNEKAGIVPAWVEDTEQLHANPVGPGAFTIENFDVGGLSVFAGRDDYHLGATLLGKITVTAIPDSDARVAAALAGQIDMVGGFSSITAAQASLFEGDPDFRIQENPRGQLEMFVMIVTEPPFDNPLLRQALKTLVDAEEMIAISAQGHGTPMCNYTIWPIDQYYVPHTECDQDLEGARALLAEAGYPDGITLPLATSNLRPVWPSQAVVFKEQAAEAGVTIEIDQRPSDGYWIDVWMVNPFHTVSWRFRWADSHMGLQHRCVSKWNDHFWCDPAFDALQDQARMTLDFNDRKDLYQQAAQIAAEDGGIIAPFVSSQIRAVNNRLQGVPPNIPDYQFPYYRFYIVEP